MEEDGKKEEGLVPGSEEDAAKAPPPHRHFRSAESPQLGNGTDSRVRSSAVRSIDGALEAGHAREPDSSRLEQSHQPLRSQKRILRKLRTTPARVSKDLRRSVAPAARKTRAWPRKRSIGGERR